MGEGPTQENREVGKGCYKRFPRLDRNIKSQNEFWRRRSGARARGEKNELEKDLIQDLTG
eukprot:5405757-Pyramimonas_sp.AAC.1